MEIDTKILFRNSKDIFEAIKLYGESGQNLIEALFIIDRLINDDRLNIDEFEKKRINRFINKFTK